MPALYPIVALWSHPRSMSTVIERVMRERGDLTCLHEPFMYDYYIHRSTRKMPHFEPQDDHPVSYDEVRDMILHRAKSGPVFLKDMSYYVMPHILEDEILKDRLTSCFLIRNPIASILSYFKLDPGMMLEEIGLEAEWTHFSALKTQLGRAPIVLDSDRIRADPKQVIGALWNRLGLPFVEGAFDWQDNAPADWKQVAGWHKDVMGSTEIRPADDSETGEKLEALEALYPNAPQLKTYLEHHLPYYERFHPHILE